MKKFLDDDNLYDLQILLSGFNYLLKISRFIRKFKVHTYSSRSSFLWCALSQTRVIVFKREDFAGLVDFLGEGQCVGEAAGFPVGTVAGDGLLVRAAKPALVELQCLLFSPLFVQR